MKLLILLALLVSCACTNMKTKPALTVQMPEPTLELNDQGIPVDCYDSNGQFDENRGHDYLDCDNLDNRVQF